MTQSDPTSSGQAAPADPPRMSGAERLAWLRNFGLPIVALGLFLVGAYRALWVAPPDQMMGDVVRIMFVHVPSAWVTMGAFTVTLIASVVYLMRSSQVADAVAEASAEVGVFFCALLLITGSIWGRPTWGVWWTWDPRLTTAAIMFFAFAGYLALRRFVDSPERRATWAAIVAMVIYVDVVFVYMSVKWWNSLHQVQSSPSTVDAAMVPVLRANAMAFTAIGLAFGNARFGMARLRQRLEQAGPMQPAIAPRVSGDQGAAS